MNKILLKFFVFLLVAASIFLIRYHKHLRGVFVESYGFEKISTNVYVSSGTPKAIRERLLLTIDSAKSRVTRTWGGIKADVNIIYCADSVTERMFNPSSSSAGFVVSPFFNHVVAGQNGLTSSVIGHELCHAELYSRLPFPRWLLSEYFIPIWFDEGLAMQMNTESRYSDEMWVKYSSENKSFIPNFASLASKKYFYNELQWYNYMYSKNELARWLDIVGSVGLNDLIDSLPSGDFHRTYSEIEARYRTLE
jgi:hypothetical protein